METGFVDQSHFSNNFKEYIGLTPKQYKNILQIVVIFLRKEELSNGNSFDNIKPVE